MINVEINEIFETEKVVIYAILTQYSCKISTINLATYKSLILTDGDFFAFHFGAIFY